MFATAREALCWATFHARAARATSAIGEEHWHEFRR
jgi:hypothetical protein